MKEASGEDYDKKGRKSSSLYSQHPSLRRLTALEKKYLLAVEHGDAATVQKIFTMYSREPSMPLDVNCKDSVGRSAILMAIDNENLEMLKLLLKFRVECRDGLLHAINAQFVEAVELFLDHEEIVDKEGKPHSWEKSDGDISSFTPEITPLILAAHKDNYEILKILLDRGSTLPMPHDVRCRCHECVQAMNEDCLCHSRSRINAYKALSSPSLICLSSIDPILTAFELSWELERLSVAEPEFKDDYEKLRVRCQDFATALLAQARSSRELSVILTHNPVQLPLQSSENIPLTRIEMGLKYQQKKFIAHPNVQQLLSSLWYDGLPGFRQLNSVQQLWEIIKIGVLFPLYSVIYMAFPHSNRGKLIRKPFFKFILHSFSYLFFLFLLLLASQRIETVLLHFFGSERMRIELLESMKKQRGQPPTVIETSIFLFIVAHVWQETRELWNKGFILYFQNMWNVIDFTRNLLHVGTAFMRILAYIQAQSEVLENPMAVYIPREAWDAFDPMLIADGLFAAGNVFAALKLVHIFSINPYLGPLQISLGRMVIDIIKFFFIYTLVLFAFACGLNQLLWYYADMEKKQCFSGPDGTENWITQRDSCLAWRRFSNLFESVQTLFWATFGLVDISTFELTGIKSYTRFWGLLMFGSYSVINVVVLLNLLIAMMSNSYQIISERADEEWKFARTKLFMNYFEQGSTVPPPFNIFPTAKNLMNFFSKKDGKKNLSLRRKENMVKERDTVYQNVMCNLVWRYVTYQQKSCESDPVTEDHIKEVRQDVSSFRHDLMNVLRCNGLNTKGVDLSKNEVTSGKVQVSERRLMKDFSIGLVEVCVEDAAPEVRANKSVLARLVGLSGGETGGSQRWRDLIQLAKKSKMIGCKNSPTVSRQASTVNEASPECSKDDASNVSDTAGDTTKVQTPNMRSCKDQMEARDTLFEDTSKLSLIPKKEQHLKQHTSTLLGGITLSAASLADSTKEAGEKIRSRPQKSVSFSCPSQTNFSKMTTPEHSKRIVEKGTSVQLNIDGTDRGPTANKVKLQEYETPKNKLYITDIENSEFQTAQSSSITETLQLQPSPMKTKELQEQTDMKPLIDFTEKESIAVQMDYPAGTTGSKPPEGKVTLKGKKIQVIVPISTISKGEQTTHSQCLRSEADDAKTTTFSENQQLESHISHKNDKGDNIHRKYQMKDNHGWI